MVKRFGYEDKYMEKMISKILKFTGLYVLYAVLGFTMMAVPVGFLTGYF
nr:MAG TPA: hypothetical protein [Caudoviricetes sp.]